LEHLKKEGDGRMKVQELNGIVKILLTTIIIIGVAIIAILTSSMDAEIDCEINELETHWVGGEVSCPAIIEAEGISACIVPKNLKCHAEAKRIPVWMAMR
jgi:hypothetical protein